MEGVSVRSKDDGYHTLGTLQSACDTMAIATALGLGAPHDSLSFELLLTKPYDERGKGPLERLYIECATQLEPIVCSHQAFITIGTRTVVSRLVSSLRSVFDDRTIDCRDLPLPVLYPTRGQ